MKCQLQGNVIMVTDLTSALDFELAQKEVCKLEQEQFVAAAVFFQNQEINEYPKSFLTACNCLMVYAGKNIQNTPLEVLCGFDVRFAQEEYQMPAPNAISEEMKESLRILCGEHAGNQYLAERFIFRVTEEDFEDAVMETVCKWYDEKPAYQIQAINACFKVIRMGDMEKAFKKESEGFCIIVDELAKGN